jgi:hypothetical protein
MSGVVIINSFDFSASRRLKFSYKNILPCTAFPSTLVSMLKLSPPLPVLLLLRVRAPSRLNTLAIQHNSRELLFQLPVPNYAKLGYLEVTVQEKLRSGWPGSFVKVEGCCD